MEFTRTFLDEVANISRLLDVEAIERAVDVVADVRDHGGRL